MIQHLHHLTLSSLLLLQEPVLRAEDIEMLISATNQPYPLNVLKKVWESSLLYIFQSTQTTVHQQPCNVRYV